MPRNGCRATDVLQPYSSNPPHIAWQGLRANQIRLDLLQFVVLVDHKISQVENRALIWRF